jgi:hypothetical protein
MSTDNFGSGIHSLNFSVVTVLFAVLYGISSQGYRSSKDHGWSRGEGLKQDFLKKACTTAFVGILFSFSLAWFSYLVPEKYAAAELIVPAGLITLWWYCERRGSSVIDVEALASSLNASYVTIVLGEVKKLDPKDNGLTAEEEDSIYKNCLQTATTETELLPDAINKIFPNSRALVPVKVLATVGQSLIFSRERFNLILTDIRSKGLLHPRLQELNLKSEVEGGS